MNDVFGKQLGQYVLLEQIGEGGMAKVYNALDTRRESNVAIKVILPSKRSTQVFLEQFKMEAQSLAKLTHTNIVKVLNYGIENEQPYLVMEYVPGGTLKDAMNQKLPWQTAAAILAPVARALEYVHRQQIVHRDVKPSNILLQEDFRPMLSDFGILKLLETKEEKVSSAIGVGVGTPEYMSPEQGMGKDVDFRADIYSLGLVFYELVTGRKPFIADTPMAMVLRHVTDELPLPTSIDRKIPKFVERAMTRALQKKPEDRYASMGDFADALELIALGKNAPEKKILKIATQRNKKQVFIPVVLLTLFLATVVGVSVWGYSKFYATPPQQTVEPSPVPAVVSNTELESTKTPTPITEETSEPLPTSTPAEEPASGPANTQVSGVTLLGTPLPIVLPSKAEEIARWGIGGVSVVDWSEEAVALGTTNGIFLYDSQDKELILFIDTKFNVTAMAFSPDGSGITAGSTDGDVITWDTRTGAVIQDFNNVQAIVTAITYSANGRNIAVGYSNGTINYFSTSQSSPVTRLDEYPTVEDLAISADGRFIYASNGKNTVSVWDIQKQTKESDLVHTASISNLSLSSDRQFMLSGGSTNAVYLWDLSDPPRLVSGFIALGGTAIDFDFSYDDKYAVIGLSTGEIKIFEIPTPENYSKTQVPIHTKKGYAEQIRSVALSPTQLIAATGNWEEGLKLWDVLSGENTFSLDQSMRAIEEIYFSNDGSWLATSHDGGTVRVWRVDTAEEAYQFPGYLPQGVPFSPDNKYLTFIKPSDRNRSESIQVIELATGNPVAVLPGFPQDAAVRFRTDSKLLVAGTPYEAVIWDVATWEKLASAGGPTAGCGQFFTPENNLLSVISDGGIFFSYDKNIQDMCGLAKTIAGATFMYYFPDRNDLLFVLGDGTIWIGNNSDSSRSRILASAPHPLPGSVFIAGHESGLYAQAVGDNLLIKAIINSTSTTIRHNDDYLYRVAFLPGKKLLALGSKYGSIHIWAMP